MSAKGLIKIPVYLLCVALFSACGAVRNLPEGDAFFRRHEVKVHDASLDYNVPDDDLISLTRQKPNRRILWWRFNHTVYLMVNKKKLEGSKVQAAERCVKKNERRKRKGKELKEKCNTWRTFWAETVGEATAVLDTAKVTKSAQQMNVYLQKKGYFDNKVLPELVYNEKKNKCIVVYHVYPSQPYRLRKITYTIEDAVMAASTPQLRKNSILDSAMVFDLDVLDDERDNITTFYNNRGYYELTKDYINYDARKEVGDHQVDIELILSRPLVASTEFPDSLVSIPHKKYFIGDIYVHTDFDATQNYAPTDTLLYDGMKVVYTRTPSLTPQLISCIQGYHSGELFQREKVDKTYKRYSQLGVLRATTIQMVPRQEIINGLYIVDTHIKLTPAKKQYFRIEPQVTHRSGNMGVYGNLLYSNRNIFGGAEALDARVIVGLEASQTLVSSGNTTSDAIRRNFQLNTFEIGPELTYRLPRLWPLSCDRTKRSSEPTSAVSAAFNYQSRPDYARTLSQIKFSWNFIENPTKVTRVTVDWVDFSIIKIDNSIAFQNFLDNLNDAFLANSYQNHLIHAETFSVTWNSQKARFQRNYFYWRAGVTEAGLILNGIMHLANAPKDEQGSRQIAGIRFAQFGRIEQDLRLYFNVNEKNGFVWRLYGGAGVPYGNLKVLPFEKSFFSGGSNGIRAWQARTLGPGSSRDSTAVRSFNNIGEIKLEGNFEYRFKMTEMFNLALFVDAGNIWLLNPLSDRPNADFTSDRFVSEIAIGTGIGLRLNFDIFLVRLDLGIKLKDPSKVQGERWLWEPKDEYLTYLKSIDDSYVTVPTNGRTVLNLGIGFPF